MTTAAAMSMEAQQQYLANQTIIRSFNLEKSVYVGNIAKPVTEAVLKQFFSHCGEVVQLKILQQPLTEMRYAYVEFKEPASVKTALMLNNIQLIDKPLAIQEATKAVIQSFEAPRIINPILTLDPNLAQAVYKNPNMGVTTSHGTTQKLEEVARTVYVGNVNPTTTPEELMNFFGVCGQITFLRMAGDDVHTNRFAFIEFATLEAAAKALTMNGVLFKDRCLRVNHSKNPIVKPPPEQLDPHLKTQTARKLSKVIEAINAKVAQSDPEVAKQLEERSRSKSRHSRSRSKSPPHSPKGHSQRRRSRSRSHSRHSHSRSRDRHRSRHRHSRSRDRHRHSRSRDRDRDKDKSKDRDERSRHLDREKERESRNEKAKEENNNSENTNRKRSRSPESHTLEPPTKQTKVSHNSSPSKKVVNDNVNASSQSNNTSSSNNSNSNSNDKNNNMNESIRHKNSHVNPSNEKQ
jgi:arginine/serine-rich splicing factor 12